jgi:cytochrome c554/c'-like protein
VIARGFAIAAVGAIAIATTVVLADTREDKAAAGKRAFADVAAVLQSPRCRNCHPAGNAPLQGERGRPHAMNISRTTAASGVPCSTCHGERNADAIGIAGGPPGVPGWRMPPAEMPMVFEGKSATALCEQLKDPARNGGRSLAALLDHVSHDALVVWGWTPGGKRSAPPLAHGKFVEAFATWVAGGGACP